MATCRLEHKVTQSMFPSMFQNLNRWRWRWNCLRGMEFAVDVGEYMESWRDRICLECQGRHILSEGLVSGGVLWHLPPPFKGVTAWHCWWWSGMKGDSVEFCPLDVSGCSWVFPMKFHDEVWGMSIFPRFPGIVFNSVSFPFDQVAGSTISG